MLTQVLFLDKLCVKCESFKAIELEMPMLLEFLERHRARHLFRSSHLNSLFTEDIVGQILKFSSFCDLFTSCTKAAHGNV